MPGPERVLGNRDSLSSQLQRLGKMAKLDFDEREGIERGHEVRASAAGGGLQNPECAAQN